MYLYFDVLHPCVIKGLDTHITYSNMYDMPHNTLSDQLTNFLTQLPVSLLAKQYPAFCGTKMFITLFTTARHASLSWVKLIQPTPSSISLRSRLILSIHLCLVLVNGLFPSGFPTEAPYVPHLSFVCAPCRTLLIHFNLFMWVILARSTNPEAPDWTVFSSHMVLPLFCNKRCEE